MSDNDTHPELCRRLRTVVRATALHCAMPPSRYDPGDVLDLEITGVCPAVKGRAKLEIDRFVGGGFAGQVYKTRLVELDADDGIPGVEVGGVYAVKILIPPSRFSHRFRNVVYWAAYQGPFAAQVNPAAARTGVLWQKLIRRGASIRFDDDRAVADTYATFFDEGLGSYGEINEWVDGRNWQFEVDDQIRQRRKQTSDTADSSREYLAKQEFMAELVRLFHEMGAPELARQYEWWTCKSQPNVLKRLDAGDGPRDGLTALDFRAGLALLPFLPMSPADFGLILRGLLRGRLVQFDRGDLDQLESFMDEEPEAFENLRPALEELKIVDPQYRASLPDVTHHRFRLLVDRDLRQNVKSGLVQGWQVRGLVDETHGGRLRKSFFGFWFFLIAGVIPVLGRLLRRLFGNAAYRRHVAAFWTSFGYMGRTVRAHQAQRLLEWYRCGRTDEDGVDFFLARPGVYWMLRIFPGLLPLPAKWHRFLVDPKFAWASTKDTVTYPIRFYRDAEFRVEWLTDEIEDGAREGMLTPEEKDHILKRVPDPYIQKYLKCVAVHFCTLPITQVVSVIVAIWGFLFLGKTYTESTAWALGILAAFQITPISPGSFVRGAYVVYLMIKERNWRNYWIAVIVSFWKYIGYLGFPLQMVGQFPALARFMGGRWATRMVGFIPVFGERGALLEHWVFDMFFNVPLSIKRWFLGRGRTA